MTISDFSLKIDLRLNKSANNEYDAIWSDIKEEAANKAVTDWVRRQIRGKNQTQEGDEETTARVDDLQILLKSEPLRVSKKDRYYETEKIPSDYIYYKRLTPTVKKGECPSLDIKSYFSEEANVDDISYTTSSFDFEETSHTMVNNKFRIYYKNFEVEKVLLTYYRKPKKLNFNKLNDNIEFKDDVCEMIIDETIKIIASDIESLNQKSLAQERVENNN